MTSFVTFLAAEGDLLDVLGVDVLAGVCCTWEVGGSLKNVSETDYSGGPNIPM